MSMTLSEVLAAAGFKDYFDYTRAMRNFSPYRYNKWRRMYGELINDVFKLDGKKVLDVGCAGGTNVKVFWTHGADSYGCDINERCIRKSPFKSINARLSVIETDRIDEYYDHESFDFIHSQQVFEHFESKEYSEKVVSGVCRLLKPGGVIYVGLVAGEHISAEDLVKLHLAGKDIDITHFNIWPMKYWHHLFLMGGLLNADEYYLPKFTGNQLYEKYKWHQMVFRKPL